MARDQRFHLLSPEVRGLPTCNQIRMCIQLDAARIVFFVTVNKTHLKSGHSKIDKTILMTNGSLMWVESIAE